MKINFIILSLCIASYAGAQTIEIKQDQVEYEKNQYPSYSIYLEPDAKDVKKELKDYIKDEYDIKMKGIGFLSNKDVLYAEEEKIKIISDKKIDFFAKVVEEGDRTKVSLFAAHGYDVPIGPLEDYAAYSNLRKLLVNFVNDYIPGYYNDQYEDALDNVKDYREDKADIKDDIADNESDIEEKLEEIKKLREENKKLAEDLDNTSKKLGNSEMTLEEMKRELERVNKKLKKLGGNN